MSEPYLILHKVRGEPAFDIAERLEVEGYDEPWWIIPTSGHRAYPAMSWDLSRLIIQIDGYDHYPFYFSEADLTRLPEHYHVEAGRSRLATAASDILSIMGLGKAKPQAPVKRRVIP